MEDNTDRKIAPERKRTWDRLSNAYTRRIKKWIPCPACQRAIMRIDNSHDLWTCEECGYQVSASSIENTAVFWYCAECHAYLNRQDGFDSSSERHVCTKCGYDNDLSEINIKGVCRNCGASLPNFKDKYCADCKRKRRDKTIKRLVLTGEITAVVVAALHGLSDLASSKTDGDYGFEFDDDERYEEGKYFKKYSDRWMSSATDEDLDTEREKVRIKWCGSSSVSMDEAEEIYETLGRFDEEMSRRAWGDEEPHAPSRHREHGWYLPNDD